MQLIGVIYTGVSITKSIHTLATTLIELSWKTFLTRQRRKRIGRIIRRTGIRTIHDFPARRFRTLLVSLTHYEGPPIAISSLVDHMQAFTSSEVDVLADT